MNYDMKQSGERIRQLRTQCGYTQEEFAKTLNVDRSTLSRIESGKRSCSLDLLIQFSDLLGVTLDYLVLGNSELLAEETAHLKEHIEGLIEQLERFKSIL